MCIQGKIEPAKLNTAQALDIFVPHGVQSVVVVTTINNEMFGLNKTEYYAAKLS